MLGRVVSAIITGCCWVFRWETDELNVFFSSTNVSISHFNTFRFISKKFCWDMYARILKDCRRDCVPLNEGDYYYDLFFWFFSQDERLTRFFSKMKRECFMMITPFSCPKQTSYDQIPNIFVILRNWASRSFWKRRIHELIPFFVISEDFEEKRVLAVLEKKCDTPFLFSIYYFIQKPKLSEAPK